MRKYILLFISMIVLLESHAHEFYFAFAEVSYDELTERIEATIILTSHDLEKSLTISGNNIRLSSDKVLDSVAISTIEKELNKGFYLQSGGVNSYLKLDGYETLLNGTTQFYLSGIFRKNEGSTIHFPLLMDVFPDQQNKLTWIFRGEKETYVFLPAMTSQKIRTISTHEK